jgi:hypothetical protein
MTTNASPEIHTGGCHCGAVRYEAELDLAGGGAQCNCSVCAKINGVTTLVKPAQFRLVQGADSLSTYEWGARIGQRKFCKHCGVHVFAPGHLKEVGGDYVSIALNTLDDFDLSKTTVRYWDGRHDNWQGGMQSTPWPVA